MKVLLLILAALGLIVYFVLDIVDWPGKEYAIMASLVFFVIGIIVDYSRKNSRDILDDEFLDDV